VIGPVWRHSVHLLSNLLLHLQDLGGGGGRSLLPFAPNPLGELRVVPTI
jgi:hypothetical protein